MEAWKLYFKVNNHVIEKDPNLWMSIAWSCNLSKLRHETAIHSCSCFGGQSRRPSRPSQTSVRSWSMRRKVSSQTSNTNGILSLNDGPVPIGAVHANVCFDPHVRPEIERTPVFLPNKIRFIWAHIWGINQGKRHNCELCYDKFFAGNVQLLSPDNDLLRKEQSRVGWVTKAGNPLPNWLCSFEPQPKIWLSSVATTTCLAPIATSVTFLPRRISTFLGNLKKNTKLNYPTLH